MSFLIIFTIGLAIALFVLLALAIWLADCLNKALSREIQLKESILSFIGSDMREDWGHKRLCDHFKIDDWSAQ